jgi:hypothetical protein
MSMLSANPRFHRSINFLSISNKLIDQPKAMIPLARWVSAVRVPVYDAVQRAADPARARPRTKRRRIMGLPSADLAVPVNLVAVTDRL